jgi:hypothetical protein
MARRRVQRGKQSKPFSARLDADVIERLQQQSRRIGESNAKVAGRLIDEGLRMEQFRGIVFRSGPTGRRAALEGGPDVWEVVRALRRASAEEDVSDPVEALVQVIGLRRELVELAAAYYDAFPEEIDDRIRLDEEMAERVRRAIAGSTVA